MVVVVPRINLRQLPIIALDPRQTLHNLRLLKDLLAQLRRIDQQQLDALLCTGFPDVGNSLELEERDEEQGVDAAPYDKGPIGSVPEPRDEEDDEDVADGLGFENARTAERVLEVVAELVGQGDVPPPPE